MRMPQAAAAAALTAIAVAAHGAPPSLDAQAIVQSPAIVPPKAQRSPVERKVDPTLASAARAVAQARARAPAQPVPAFVQSFVQHHVANDGRTFVVVKGDVTKDLLGFLASIGAVDVRPYAQYGQVTARVPIESVLDIAQRQDVRTVGPREIARTNRYVPGPDELQLLKSAVANTGTTQWQGVTAHKADIMQAAGITGAGAKVCVLSDGIDSLGLRQAGGDLPAGVTVLTGEAGSGDEGTAMLEIVHDMAPGAALGFATAFNGSASFASNIISLRDSAGCDIIVDDVSYIAEGAFQDDIIAQAVNHVTASGALYFSSAANSGNVTHGSSGTFEGDFIPSPAPLPAAIAAIDSGTLMAFGATPYATLTDTTDIVSLKWSDPLGGSANDYDLFVLDPSDTSILCNPSIGYQDGTADPVEVAYCDSGQVFPVDAHVYVVKYAGSARAMRIDTHRGKLAQGTPGSTYGHNAAGAAVTVAATYVGGGSIFAGGATNPVEWYSSDGPRRMFYNPNGTAITPGNVLFDTGGGTTLQKVDVTAADCGATATAGFTIFCGTSAAAPTAASIAALMKSARPSASAAQIRTALLNATKDIEGPGIDRDSGHGIVMAPGAVLGNMVPLAISKGFQPAAIAPGGVSQLAITIANGNDIALTGVQVTDFFPSGVVAAADPLPVSSPCPNTPFVNPGETTWTVTATLPAHTSCTFVVAVTAAAPGTYVDSGGTVTSQLGLGGSLGSATLAVSGGTPGESNVALGSAGATASASSTGGSAFPASSLIDGDRAGLNWGAGGGWKDNTSGVFPDWVEVDFAGPKTIDRVVVYSLQDDPFHPIEPGDATTFTQFGATAFDVQAWNGSSWVTVGSVTGNNLVKRSVGFAAVTTDRIRVSIDTVAGGPYSRLVEVEAFGGDAASAPSIDAALASNGATVTASSSAGPAFPPESLIDGDREGVNWGSGGGWKDATPNAFPDSVEIDFGTARTIDHVAVYSLQDDPFNPVEPTDTTAFTQFGVIAFNVGVWDGTNWVQVGSVTGNNLVKRTVSFPATTTTKIRVVVVNAMNGVSRLTEVEAWTVAARDYALAANGGTASASSSAGANFPVASLIDGDRKGLDWGSTGGWKDGTANTFPDWVEINLGAAHDIGRVVVYSLQDDISNPVEPTDSTTFSMFGATDFDVQAWDGAAWVTVGTVTGNNLVKRGVTFPSVNTTKIRVNVNGALNGYSRLVEIEAWGS